MFNWKLDTYAFCMSISAKRYEYLCKNFEAVKLKMPVLYNGVRWNGGSNTGCVLAHIGIIMLARQFKLPYCVIYEDDAFPRPDVKEMFDRIIPKIPDDCGILKMGSSSYRGEWDVINDVMLRMSKGTSYGSHAYLIRSELYDRAIETMYNVMLPDVSMNSEYYQDLGFNSYVLNFENMLYIQKNINADNIISNRGGERYWYPGPDGAGVTSAMPCKNFVDNLFSGDNYVEVLDVVYNEKWEKKKQTVFIRDSRLITKYDTGVMSPIEDKKYLLEWKINKEKEHLIFLGFKCGVRYWKIEQIKEDGVKDD